MNDDLTFLASAYLDGETDADERARVEADPALLAEVERLRAVRAVLGDVEPAGDDTREHAIAAALAAWDDDHGLADTAAAAPSTATGATPIRPPAPSRRGGTRAAGWLAAAAAAVVVLGGIAASVNLTGGDDDSDSAGSADVAEDTIAAEPEPEPSGGDDELRVLEDAAAETESASETHVASDAGADAPSADDDGSAEQSASEYFRSGAAQISGPDELAGFIADAEAAFSSERASETGDTPPAESADTVAPPVDCTADDRTVVGAAQYRGRDVVVAVDEAVEVGFALDPTTCTVLEQVTLD